MLHDWKYASKRSESFGFYCYICHACYGFLCLWIRNTKVSENADRAKTWATKCCPGTYKNNYQLCCGIKVIFVCGKDYEHKYIREWLGDYEAVGVEGISKEKLAELRFNDSSLHLPKVIRTYHPRYLQMNKNKTNWGKEIYSILEKAIRDL